MSRAGSINFRVRHIMASSSPAKRQRVGDTAGSGQQHAQHPYGIEPYGNYYAVSMGVLPGVKGNTRDSGLGRLAGLPDDAVMGLLHYFDAEELCQLSAASRGSYVWAHLIDLWRALVLQRFGGAFVWAGDWKSAFVATATAACGRRAPRRHTPLPLRGFYSDLLYQSWHMGTAALAPEWLAGEAISVESAQHLTKAAFRQRYEARNLPVLITDALQHWAARKWTVQGLAQSHGDRPVTCGHYDVALGTYAAYCRTMNGQGEASGKGSWVWDDQPLYMFDRHFADRLPGAADAFSVPEYFDDDLFAVLGEARPAHRWLIGGPRASGSTWHVDPNGTSAWNAVLSGRKKWIMYPPGAPPPGVHPSADGAEVATPLALAEWFTTFYSAHQERKAEAWAAARAAGKDPLTCGSVPLEFNAPEGSLLFVPSGWWHMALNVEPDTLAITQNFVSRVNLAHVLHFLRSKPEQVSGVPVARRAAFAEEFVTALKEKRPGVWAEYQQQVDAMAQQQAAADAKYRQQGAGWQDVMSGAGSAGQAGSGPSGGAFSFSFAL